MQQTAAIFDSLVLYRYSLILALAGAASICFFLACCMERSIPLSRSSTAALTATVLSLGFGRLVFWYARPDSFASAWQAVTSPVTEGYALMGVFLGCGLSALTCPRETRKDMLDAMSVAGCFGIALGRLGSFFTETDRGQVTAELTSLPWAWPVANASGVPEYRFATFLFQAAVAAVLGVFLATVFFRRMGRPGDVTVLFALCYSASQVILDSTRYDSLYFRSNGFISMVQVLSSIALVAVLVLLNVRTVRSHGLKRWTVPLWILLTALLGIVGYMEYYVQRHGREAAFSYTVMGLCLAALVGLGLLLWKRSCKMAR